MKLPGVISLRKDLPTCAIPNGGFLRENCSTFLKLMKMPCAVSGRRYAVAPDSLTGPIVVSNIRLKSRASVRSHSSVSPGCLDGLRPHGKLREVIGAEALPARAAINERIGEAGEVT